MMTSSEYANQAERCMRAAADTYSSDVARDCQRAAQVWATLAVAANDAERDRQAAQVTRVLELAKAWDAAHGFPDVERGVLQYAAGAIRDALYEGGETQ